jgi:hypothetical protein
MIPSNPQPLEELIARFPMAMGTLYQQDKCQIGIQVPPGTLPEHVFDTSDGLRMIASREDWAGEPIIHLSFGVDCNFVGNFNPHSFIAAAKSLAWEFVGDISNPEPIRVEITNKALHLWFQRI